MALIKCEDCGQEVSSRAPACPKCGGPINERRKEDPAGVQTIQATGKAWKAVQAIGVIMVIGGVVTCSASAQNPQAVDQTPALAGGVAMLGFIVFMVGRIGAWWNHQ